MHQSVLSNIKVSRLIFGLFLAVIFSVVFGSSVYGHFVRQTGPVGWYTGYGYGYGYGYGLGWEHGVYAGYKMQFTNYLTYSITFDPYEMTSGTSVGLNDDEVSDAIPLPFPFEFYGETYYNFRISSNGFITFVGNSGSGCCSGQVIPDQDSPNCLIAGAWTNLYPPGAESGSISYQVFGTAPNRVMVVDFDDVPECCSLIENADNWANFQIAMHENGMIDIHIIEHELDGRTVTVGVESPGGYAATPVPGINGQSSTVTEQSYRFVQQGYSMANVWGYGYGYGLMLPDANGPAPAYDQETDSYHVSSDYIPFGLLRSGLVAPVGEQFGNTTAIRFYANVNLWVGEHRVYIPEGTIFEAGESTNFEDLFMDNDVDLENLSFESLADFAFGLPTLGLSISPAIDVYLAIDDEGVQDGQILSIWRQDAGEKTWGLTSICQMDEGICSFSTAHLSSFAAGPYSDDDEVVGDVALTLTRPNGGETITGGTDYQINWASTGSGIDRIRISLSNDSGATYPSVITTNAANTGFYTWSVPSSATTTARIKLEAIDSDDEVLDDVESGNDFTIDVQGGGGGGGGGGLPPADDGDDEEEDDNTGTIPGWTDPLDRQSANASFVGSYAVDDIVKLPDDQNPSTTTDSTVYYLGLDGKRHPFMDRQTFDTWYPDFSLVKPITEAELAAIPLGGSVMPRPGTMWVKITSTPETYYIAPGGNTLHWIIDEPTALAMAGPDWNTKIMDVDVSMFSQFNMGDPITLTDLASGYPAGQLLRSAPGEPVWYTTETGRRLVADAAAMDANYFQERFVETLDEPGWQTMIAETLITGFEEALVSLAHF